MKQLDKDLLEIINNKDLFCKFRGKTIFISGATGLIGSMLVRSFHAANEKYELGINIIGQIRSYEKAKHLFLDFFMSEDISFVKDYSGKCDYIFHTASPTASKFFIDHPVETIVDSVTGTRNALELARNNNAVMVYLSSMEQYGVPKEDDIYMTEEKVGVINHLCTRSSYSEGKRLCECLCIAYSSEYGVNVKIARLAQTFGAGVCENDKRMSIQFAKAVINNEDIVLHTKGKSYSNFVYLTDAIIGLLVIAENGENQQAYNICNDTETRTVYEIAQLVCENVANKLINVRVEEIANMGYAPDVKMFLKSSKLKMLGWTPKVGMSEGYLRLVRYLNNEDA